MSLLFFDGFDSYNTLGQVYDVVVTSFQSNPSIASTAGRFSTAGFTNPGSNCWVRKAVTPSATLVAGCAVQPVASWNNQAVSAFWQAGTAQVWASIATDGSVQVWRGPNQNTNTLIVSTTAGVWSPLTSYRYLELKAGFHTSSGFVILRLDGAVIATATNINTSPTGAASADAWSNGVFQSGTGADGRTMNQDDIYVLNTSGSRNTDFLGDVRSVLFTLTADATVTGFSPSTGTLSYAMIDENPPNDDTDYLTSSASGDVVLVNTTGTLTSTSGMSIFAAQVRWRGRKDNAGGRAFTGLIKHNGTSSAGAAYALASTYVTRGDIFEVNPSTGNAWTPTEVTAAQPGVQTSL